jgi:hypothetical protein
MALGVDSSLTELSTRNIPGVKRGRHVRLTSSSSVSRLSRKCRILDVSQTHGHLRRIIGIASLSLLIAILGHVACSYHCDSHVDLL